MRHCHHAWPVDKAHDANTIKKGNQTLPANSEEMLSTSCPRLADSKAEFIMLLALVVTIL